MGAETGSPDWRERKVREWLLLLLRFAVTREPADQSAALAMADELDSLGLRWRPAGPRFFLATSCEVCSAILADGEGSSPVLREHIARIEDPRLKRAFRAAVTAEATAETRRHVSLVRPGNGDLWKGLRRR
jgi:hypothetical protein